MRGAWLVLLSAAIGFSAAAELQQVDVGGEVRIRGRYYRNAFNPVMPGVGNRALRWPTPTVFKRALGPFGLTSIFDFDDWRADFRYVEQRSLFNVKADFTRDVSAFFEFSSYDIWGEDFRSNYITAQDSRSASGDDVEVFQAYIDADRLGGQPLRLRIGRQELTFGKGWIYGSRSTPLLAISYDGIRATYSPENLVVDAWWAKLAETSPLEEDGDVDYYGVYATYSGLEALNVSAHY
ncbi:MAG: alginate export family protein, partial [Candidatus Hydrogenedentes bacterium]|nr:alginate export family protein [Candidatus Hydrogenedentota bacterium]